MTSNSPESSWEHQNALLTNNDIIRLMAESKRIIQNFTHPNPIQNIWLMGNRIYRPLMWKAIYIQYPIPYIYHIPYPTLYIPYPPPLCHPTLYIPHLYPIPYTTPIQQHLYIPLQSPTTPRALSPQLHYLYHDLAPLPYLPGRPTYQAMIYHNPGLTVTTNCSFLAYLSDES